MTNRKQLSAPFRVDLEALRRDRRKGKVAIRWIGDGLAQLFLQVPIEGGHYIFPDTSPDWMQWFIEADQVQAVFEVGEKPLPECTEEQGYKLDELSAALRKKGLCGLAGGHFWFRIWFRRKVKNSWEPYWYAPQ